MCGARFVEARRSAADPIVGETSMKKRNRKGNGSWEGVRIRPEMFGFEDRGKGKESKEKGRLLENGEEGPNHSKSDSMPSSTSASDASSEERLVSDASSSESGMALGTNGPSESSEPQSSSKS